jgi:hypothetical protein
MTKKKLKMINWLDKEVQKDKIELDREKQELINRIKKLNKEDVLHIKPKKLTIWQRIIKVLVG